MNKRVHFVGSSYIWQGKFYRKFHETVMLSKATIYRTVAKFCANGIQDRRKKSMTDKLEKPVACPGPYMSNVKNSAVKVCKKC